MPPLDAERWIGSKPLTNKDLKGKVVLVDFWTYSCINCIRVTPYLNAWTNKYRDQGLIVLGVHTPEFDFEKRPENIEKEIKRFGIAYPVVVDSDYRIWNSFRNQFWPAYYLVDVHGNIRYHQFGEGNYDRAEAAIQDLLAEARSVKSQTPFVDPVGDGSQAPADPNSVGSPETYLGYRQAIGFGSPEKVRRDRSATYSIPILTLNQWALAGAWIVSADGAQLDHSGGGIAYRFKARDLHLVMTPSVSGAPIRYRVMLDGQAPGEDHGVDTDADGRGIISGPRLYQLIRQKRDKRERTFTIQFEDPGVKVFAFTFG